MLHALFFIHQESLKNNSVTVAELLWFIIHQISILEWFLKDHVRLKTGGMMLKIQLCHH